MQMERRFVLADFTYTTDEGCLLYEAGRTYPMPSAVAHAAAKRELVAKQRPSDWTPPTIFTTSEMLTKLEVTQTEAELQALQRHALGLIDPKTDI
jgi:hypothetical protein